jgi:hypothetical protein
MKYFCLQYRERKKRLKILEADEGFQKQSPDPTSELAVEIADLKYALWLIETTAYDTNVDLGKRILKIVTEDLYCGDDDHLEELRRKFYWLLSERKGI